MSEDEQRVKASTVVGDVEVFPLVEGDTVVDAILLLKVVDPEGQPGWAFRRTPAMSMEEILGALVIQARLLEQTMLKEWEVD